MTPTILAIYLKAPQPGYVKTRLAKNIGPENANTVYKALVAKQLSEVPVNIDLEVHFTPTNAELSFQEWLGNHIHFVPQVGGDLGDKLAHSVHSIFERGSGKCLCIGGDCPGLNAKHLIEAEKALAEDADVVFGPCLDGGYYLIGLKAPQPALFSDIPWSSPDTLQASLDKAQALGLKVHLLETLYDVDDQQSLNLAISDGLLPDPLAR